MGRWVTTVLVSFFSRQAAARREGAQVQASDCIDQRHGPGALRHQ